RGPWPAAARQALPASIFDCCLAPSHCLPRGSREGIVPTRGSTLKGVARDQHVRFGSKADICVAKSDVRFTPNSDRESGLRQPVMSALPPIADICGANRHICFGPKAAITPLTRAPRPPRKESHSV